MIIDKLIIKNYEIFKDITIRMNDRFNIFVGENDSGKTTILEALSIVLTGKLNGASIISRLNPDWFNYEIRKSYKENLKELPMIVIEAYFKDISDGDIIFKNYQGTNNSLRENALGVKIEIMSNEKTRRAPTK